MRLKIANPIDRDFGMVPRALWAMELPFQAKGLAAYLFCLRDGSVPYVAEIEKALGIGRDARRKAFAALEAAGLIEWHVEIDRGRIVGKTLLLHPLRCCPPENQADGPEAGESYRAPDFPADGKHVPQSTETRPSRDCGSGDTMKDKKERARKAREAAARSAPASRAPVARPMVGGSGLASEVLSDAEKIRGLWSKAGVSASLGLRWYHPTEKQSYPASAFQQMAEKSGVFCDV